MERLLTHEEEVVVGDQLLVVVGVVEDSLQELEVEEVALLLIFVELVAVHVAVEVVEAVSSPPFDFAMLAMELSVVQEMAVGFVETVDVDTILNLLCVEQTN